MLEVVDSSPPRRTPGPREVLVFAEHWRGLAGAWPARLVMDQKVTTHAVLAELDAKGINFVNLRMRSPSLVRHIAALPASAWRTVALDRDGNYKHPKVVDEEVTISGYPRTVRQLVVAGLGRDAATVIITNDRVATADTLQRRFLSTGGLIVNNGDTVLVKLKRRAYSPMLRQADLPEVAVPWWGGRTLRFEFDHR